MRGDKNSNHTNNHNYRYSDNYGNRNGSNFHIPRHDTPMLLVVFTGILIGTFVSLAALSVFVLFRWVG